MSAQLGWARVRDDPDIWARVRDDSGRSHLMSAQLGWARVRDDSGMCPRVRDDSGMIRKPRFLLNVSRSTSTFPINSSINQAVA